MTQRDEVLGIERERGLEHAARLVEAAALVQRLPVDDVPAHVSGLLRQELLADQDRLLEISSLSELIGQRSEVAAGILVELLFELVDAGGAGHQSLGGGAQAAVGEAEQDKYAKRTSQSEVLPSLDFSRCRRVAFSASIPTRFSQSQKEFRPVLQAMRSSAKFVFWILAVAFIGGFLLVESSGLLDLSAVTPTTAVATVNGTDILYTDWLRAVAAAHRSRSSSSPAGR